MPPFGPQITRWAGHSTSRHNLSTHFAKELILQHATPLSKLQKSDDAQSNPEIRGRKIPRTPRIPRRKKSLSHGDRRLSAHPRRTASTHHMQQINGKRHEVAMAFT